MRIIGAVCLLAFCSGAFADEKKFDATKLVGKWEEKAPKKDEQMRLEFTKDGKVTIAGSRGDQELKAEGTYKLDGAKLTFAVKFMDMEIEQTITITKLTDEELVGTSEQTKTEKTFVKVKAKK